MKLQNNKNVFSLSGVLIRSHTTDLKVSVLKTNLSIYKYLENNLMCHENKAETMKYMFMPCTQKMPLGREIVRFIQRQSSE